MPASQSPKSVEHYLQKGCGRCSLYDTPACKVHSWIDVLNELRAVVTTFPMEETIKWGVPVYTTDGKNVLTISALKGYCVLSFFDGYLLKDEEGKLDKAGEHSRVGRLIRFESVEQVRSFTPQLLAYIQAAMDLQKSGRKPPPPPVELEFPKEFIHTLDEDPQLHRAFTSLTKGRKRGYSLYFSSAKKTETILSRIKRCIPLIMAGKGLHE